MDQNLPRSEGPPDEHSMDDQLHELSKKYRRAITLILATMGLCLLVLIGVVIWLAIVVEGNTARNQHQIAANQAASDHRWCATMNLLTHEPEAPPANPASNPSREQNYKLYADFLALRQDFGC